MFKLIKSYLLILIILSAAFAAERGQEKPYVLIVSLDGFRWDYLDRGLSPNLTAMAKKGVRSLTFEPAFPSKTFPNHYTIVTGLYPQNHSLINNRFQNPYNGERYRIGDTSAVRDDRWYQGETLWATAWRNGVKSASYFWPGSETHLDYKHPTYFKHYDGKIPHEERIEGIIHWLQLPPEQRPHLLFLYFSDTDTQGHRHGPDSPEVNQAVKLLDEKLGYLQRRLQEIGMLQKVNIIVLSDHGMTELKPDGVIKLWQILGDETVQIAGYGPVVQFFTEDQTQCERVYQKLRNARKGFKVYRREEMPVWFHYSAHPFLGDIIAVADLGNTFVKSAKELKKISGRKIHGDHGYDNHTLDMQGIFVAAGPAFKQNYRCNTIRNIDVYPLVCKILHIIPNQKIDGKFERVGFILKEK